MIHEFGNKTKINPSKKGARLYGWGELGSIQDFTNLTREGFGACSLKKMWNLVLSKCNFPEF